MNAQQKQRNQLDVLNTLCRELSNSSQAQEKATDFISESFDQSTIGLVVSPTYETFFEEEEEGNTIVWQSVNSPCNVGDEISNAPQQSSLSPISPTSVSCHSDHDSGYSASPVFASDIDLPTDQVQTVDSLSVKDSVTELFPDLI